MQLLLMDIHHLPGQLGHFFVILSFVTALLATLSFLLSAQHSRDQEQQRWKYLGRAAFYVHSAAVVAVMSVLFFIINSNMFEYHYAWQHSSKSLPAYYQIAAFWEGQEGSFLLWSFWHTVLGCFLIYTARQWETTVLTVLSSAQVFLASMVLGIYFFGYKIGSSPFVLLKDAMSEAPIFQMNPNYIPKDGSGLNPVLQNYWMVIHPPVLFLGFASGIIPFCYSISALWKRKYKEWLNKVLPWTLFAVLALGTGIAMGAAWAYEALSFGGYWAWDPVENASLVPWLILLAGLHTVLSARNTGHGLKTSFVIFILAFSMILYATFLTRSGILGETSVHAFTDLGMSGQLVVYLLFFLVGGSILLISRWNEIPVVQKEESIYSREFWMFIAALVLILSSFQIIFDTSRPVINSLFNTNLAPPTDPIPHYNRWQLPIAIIVGLLSGAIQFFRYKKTSFSYFVRKISVALIVSLGLTFLIVALFEIFIWHYALLLFAGSFAFMANLNYIISILSGNLRLAGASIAHMGFGMLLVGVLISSYKQHPISINRMGIDFGKGYEGKEKRINMLLYKNQPKRMGDYKVTYLGDTATSLYTYFQVRYQYVNEATGQVEETFTLSPYVQTDKRNEMVASPATRHYLTKDLFTHVTSIPKKEEKRKDKSEFKSYDLKVGDTLFLSNAMAILQKVDPDPQHPQYSPQPEDVAAGAHLKVTTPAIDTFYRAEPVYLIREGQQKTYTDRVEPLELKFRFTKIKPEEELMTIGVKDRGGKEEFIILKAIVFPFINLVWLGLILMLGGVLISLTRRYRLKQR